MFSCLYKMILFTLVVHVVFFCLEGAELGTFLIFSERVNACYWHIIVTTVCVKIQCEIFTVAIDS